MTLFPAPATKVEIGKTISLRKGKHCWEATDASHVSRVENSVQILSILRTYRLSRTTPLSHYAAIGGRCYSFSMGRGEIASFEYLGAPFHLPDNQLIHAAIVMSENNRRFNVFILLAI